MKSVIILTQPRSGSSLLAGILHRFGVYMGEEKDLMMSQHKNKLGSYENQAFLKLSHNILFKAKRLMLYWKRLSDEDGKVESAVKDYEEELVKLIRDTERNLWGFKEAVLIYTLPYFHHHLKNPYYIILHRDPESVANSQARAGKLRNWWPEIRTEFSYFKPHQWFVLFGRTLRTTFTKGFLYRNKKFIAELTKDGQKRIDEFVNDKKYIRINLLDLVNEPKKAIEEIVKFLEIKPTDEQMKDALNFIHPELITSEIGTLDDNLIGKS
ncbi:MAG: sulfotransferase [Candidatus Heimdallarchaeota archaeon]